jgi:hypothetical protein
MAGAGPDDEYVEATAGPIASRRRFLGVVAFRPGLRRPASIVLLRTPSNYGTGNHSHQKNCPAAGDGFCPFL